MRKQLHTVRVSDGDIEPLDICIDHPIEIGKPVVFEIEQSESIIVTTALLKELLAVAEQMEREWRK